MRTIGMGSSYRYIGDTSTVTPASFTVGMQLINDGTASVPIYSTIDASGNPAMTVQPGQTIGTITAIGTGTGGVIYAVTNPTLESNAPIMDQITEGLWNNTFGEILPDVNISENGSVRAADLIAAVSPSQIQTQSQAIATANAANTPPSADWIPNVPNWITVTVGGILAISVVGVISNLTKD